METDARPVDPWWVVCGAVSVTTLGLLLMGDRYVELLAAGAAYAAAWAFLRKEIRPRREEHHR